MNYCKIVLFFIKKKIHRCTSSGPVPQFPWFLVNSAEFSYILHHELGSAPDVGESVSATASGTLEPRGRSAAAGGRCGRSFGSCGFFVIFINFNGYLLKLIKITRSLKNKKNPQHHNQYVRGQKRPGPGARDSHQHPCYLREAAAPVTLGWGRAC